MQTTPPAAHQPTTGSSARLSAHDDIFSFHPRVTNPELWRTTQPLVVYERCQGHKGLIATWMAIHWLIVLHAANGRCDFGVREIAARACVSRNEVSGPQGYVQRLVQLGLIQIVGYDDHDGKFRLPRPIYRLDLWELERLSIELTPDVLRAQGVAAPPRPAPDPRQTSFLTALGELHERGTATVAPDRAMAPATHEKGPVLLAQKSAMPPALHENGTAGGTDTWGVLATHENGTVLLDQKSAMPPALHENGTAGGTNTRGVLALHENGPVLLAQHAASVPGPPQKRPALHENGTVPHEKSPALAQKRDVEGGKERENEGVSEHAPTRALLHEIAAQAVQVVLDTLNQRGVLTQPALHPAAPIPQPPAGHPLLPDGLIALWQGDRGSVTQRERHQLHMLAAEYDTPSSGYGAYWVGRAILIADRCLVERGQPIKVNYLRGMLRRWQREGSWGSDLEAEGDAGPASATPRSEPAPPAPVSEGSNRPIPAAAPEACAAMAHPAIAAYVTAFREAPNTVQARQITETVSDLTVWNQVLTDWQLNGWGERSVGNMLDRYQKGLAGGEVGAADDRPLSAAPIYNHPGLSDAQRDRWIRRFRNAKTPAEQRAILAQLDKEHP